MKKNWIILGALLLAAVFLMLLGPRLTPKPESEESIVLISVGGAEYARIPLSKPQDVTIAQEDGSVNVIRITSSGVCMLSSTCRNQLCVEMGEVTEDNWEIRPNQGFIICLPNKVSVELVVKE